MIEETSVSVSRFPFLTLPLGVEREAEDDEKSPTPPPLPRKEVVAAKDTLGLLQLLLLLPVELEETLDGGRATP